MFNIKRKERLGFFRPADTNNHDLVRGGYPNELKVIEEITIANMTGGALTYRIFLKRYHKEDYGAQNAIVYDVSIAANSQVRVECQWYINYQERLGCRASAGDGIIFTAWGRVEEV